VGILAYLAQPPRDLSTRPRTVADFPVYSNPLWPTPQDQNGNWIPIPVDTIRSATDGAAIRQGSPGANNNHTNQTPATVSVYAPKDDVGYSAYVDVVYWAWNPPNSGGGGGNFYTVERAQTLSYSVMGATAVSLTLGGANATYAANSTGNPPPLYAVGNNNESTQWFQINFRDGNKNLSDLGFWSSVTNNTQYTLNFGIIQIIKSEYDQTVYQTFSGNIPTGNPYTQTIQGNNLLDQRPTYWNFPAQMIGAGATATLPPPTASPNGLRYVPAYTDNLGDREYYYDIFNKNLGLVSFDYRVTLDTYLVEIADGGIPIGIAKIEWSVAASGWWDANANTYYYNSYACVGSIPPPPAAPPTGGDQISGPVQGSVERDYLEWAGNEKQFALGGYLPGAVSGSVTKTAGVDWNDDVTIVTELSSPHGRVVTAAPQPQVLDTWAFLDEEPYQAPARAWRTGRNMVIIGSSRAKRGATPASAFSRDLTRRKSVPEYDAGKTEVLGWSSWATAAKLRRLLPVATRDRLDYYRPSFQSESNYH
jgi:hypothetical protein